MDFELLLKNKQYTENLFAIDVALRDTEGGTVAPLSLGLRDVAEYAAYAKYPAFRTLRTFMLFQHLKTFWCTA